MNLRNFFAELKRRNVYKVAIAYGVVGWLLIQIATQVFPFFEIPNWAVRLVVMLIIIGFPIALILAWAFELTPEGLKRTEMADGEPAKLTRNRTWIYLVIIAAALSIGLFFVGRYIVPSRPSLSANVSPKSIAVLPFENLSEDKANAYFAEGIQDEILTRLAKIADLKVISRTSTARYKSSPSNLSEIAKQLGVATVLEGSVQRAADQVRINVQLIKAADESHLWAETYDRKLSDIFAVESEVARNIADSLRASLSLEERARVEKKPTSNTEAYVLYLRARTSQERGMANLVRSDLDIARQLYEQTLALDPHFALAHAQLSATLGAIFHWFEPTEKLKASARREADEALRLDPALVEGHLALGFCLYWTERKYDEALREFEIAARGLPNSAEIISDVAAIRRRQGKWAEATSGFQRAADLDPRNPIWPQEVCFNFLFQRQWQAASEAAKVAVALGPDLLNIRIGLAYIDFWWKGDTRELHALLDSIPPGLDPDGLVTLARWNLAQIERDFPAAEKAIQLSRVETINSYGTPLPKSYLQGCTELARGNIAEARPLLENARQYFESQVQLSPEDGFRHNSLALVYCYLGRPEDAVREAKKAVALVPEDIDAMIGPLFQSTLALVYARAGKHEEATNLISRLLVIPGAIGSYDSNLTIPDLRSRWQWDPIRSDPRFQKILAGSEARTISR